MAEFPRTPPRQHNSQTEALPANAVPDIGELIALRRQRGVVPQVAPPQSATQTGRHLSRSRGRGMDFDESRPYQPGDDIRTIDWRVTARTTRTHTKIFREERERPVYLLVDLRHTMFFGSHQTKSVCAARMAAALAWATLQRGDRVGALVFGGSGQRDIRPRRSHHEVLRLIRALHDLAPRQPQSAATPPTLADMMAELARIRDNGATVFVISDFHDRDASVDRQWYRLARRHRVVPIMIYDRLEQELPPPGTYPVSDGERTLQLRTDLPHERRRFQALFQDHQQQLAQQANRLGARLLSCRTDQDVSALLRQYFGGDGRGERS